MIINVSVRSTGNDEKHIKYVTKALDKIYIIYACYRCRTVFSTGAEMSWCRNVFSTDAEMSWCRTVFFNGCRNVLVPNCLVFPVFTYPDILYTGKKVRLQTRIDHKMFDMFTSRNVKKIFKYPLSRPTTTTMSDQIVGLGEC